MNIEFVKVEHPEKSYYIGKYPVTQKEWTTVMGYNPSYFKGDDLPGVLQRQLCFL